MKVFNSFSLTWDFLTLTWLFNFVLDCGNFHSFSVSVDIIVLGNCFFNRYISYMGVLYGETYHPYYYHYYYCYYYYYYYCYYFYYYFYYYYHYYHYHYFHIYNYYYNLVYDCIWLVLMLLEKRELLLGIHFCQMVI